jgi:hypothetical protein
MHEPYAQTVQWCMQLLYEIISLMIPKRVSCSWSWVGFMYANGAWLECGCKPQLFRRRSVVLTILAKTTKCCMHYTHTRTPTTAK